MNTDEHLRTLVNTQRPFPSSPAVIGFVQLMFRQAHARQANSTIGPLCRLSLPEDGDRFVGLASPLNRGASLKTVAILIDFSGRTLLARCLLSMAGRGSRGDAGTGL